MRQHLLTNRRAMPSAARHHADEKLQDQTLHLVRRTAAATVAAYVPIGTEPGGPSLPHRLARHARVLLPVLLPDGDLDWAVFDGALEPGPRGLAQPAGPLLGTTAIRSVDLVLVPALAVDTAGRRLGRGGGSYDRALARLPVPSRRPMLIALLHDGELVEEVPAEAHDRPVHGVITPTGGFVTLPEVA